MKQDSSTLYKLIILYILEKISFPITKTQLYNFLLEREYTTYLPLHHALSDLLETNLITAEIIGNHTHLKITKEGKKTLSFFNNRIVPAIKEDIDLFLSENKFKIRNEISVLANYYKSTATGEFEAHLIAKEKEVILVDITLSVPTAPMAATVCDNWKEKNETIYKYLTAQLF